MNIGVITGSTRPGRRGPQVTDWVAEVLHRQPAVRSGGLSVRLVDLVEVGLPLLAEPAPALFEVYEHDTTRQWSELVSDLDAFVFVTPEYNHSLPAALKNAIDHLFVEWNDKAAGIVSYGTAGGIRAAEHLRQVLAEVKVATVRSQVALSVFDDFKIDDPLVAGQFAPRELHEPVLARLTDELLAWGGALQTLRETPNSAAAADAA